MAVERIEIAFNPCSEDFFGDFPVELQAVFSQLQLYIHRIVKKHNPEAIPTSGFRSPKYNMEIAGSKNSKHIFCLARDYRKGTIKKFDMPGLRVIQEEKCDHVEIFGPMKNPDGF